MPSQRRSPLRAIDPPSAAARFLSTSAPPLRHRRIPLRRAAPPRGSLPLSVSPLPARVHPAASSSSHAASPGSASPSHTFLRTSPKSAFALAAYARPRSDRRHRRCRRTHSSPSTPPASPLPTPSTRSSGEDQDIIHVLNRSQIGGHQVQLSWSLTPHQNKQVRVQS